MAIIVNSPNSYLNARLSLAEEKGPCGFLNPSFSLFVSVSEAVLGG